MQFKLWVVILNVVKNLLLSEQQILRVAQDDKPTNGMTSTNRDDKQETRHPTKGRERPVETHGTLLHDNAVPAATS